MNSFKIIFTIKSAIHPMTETVEASDAQQARDKLKALVEQAGLRIKHITAVIQVG